MKDPIDRFLEKYSASFMPVEKGERGVPSLGSANPKPKPLKLSDQNRWDNSMRAMGWTHLVGLTGKEDTIKQQMEKLSDLVKGLQEHMSLHKS